MIVVNVVNQANVIPLKPNVVFAILIIILIVILPAKFVPCLHHFVIGIVLPKRLLPAHLIAQFAHQLPHAFHAS
jgi:hypothetical protein